MAGQAMWPEWSTEKAIKEGYRVSYILYAVASDLAECIRSVPWQVKQRTNGGDVIVESHPLVELVRSPNTEGTWGSLMEAVDLYKSLAGNAYGVWLPVGPDDLDLWLLRPERVSIVPDARGHIDHYSYLVPGEATPTTYKPEQIVHFKFFDPGDDYYGMAPLQAASRLVDTSNDGLLWNRNSMKNRARPEMVMSPKEHLSPDQHEKLLELLKKQVDGPENARRTLIPSEPFEILQLSLTPIEMDFLNSFNTYEVGVCKVFHVHPEAIGALGATFENKEWAIRAKWEGPVQSRLSEMRATLNHKFRIPFSTIDPSVARVGDLWLDYDLSESPLADYKVSKAIERATKVWACGMPWNVAADVFGVGTPPIKGGDVGYISALMLPLGTTSQWSVDGDAGRSVRSVNLETEDQFQAHYRVTDRRKQGWERGVAVKVADQFGAQRKAVVRAVENGTRDTDDVIASFRSDWEKLLTGVERAVIADFGETVADDLNGPRSMTSAESRGSTEASAAGPVLTSGETRAYEFDAWSKSVQDWVRRHTAEAVDEIQKTTQQGIRRVVLSGLGEGWDMRRIAAAVDDQFKEWEGGSGAYRSMRIARTEVHSAASYGMHEAARQSGVVEEKAWLSSMDPPRAREEHMELSGKWIPFDEPFVMPDGTEMDCPGDGPPEHVINCRCVTMYRAGK
jgi:HK97 family phage portal protein